MLNPLSANNQSGQPGLPSCEVLGTDVLIPFSSMTLSAVACLGAVDGLCISGDVPPTSVDTPMQA
jgi:hypothetical protein